MRWAPGGGTGRAVACVHREEEEASANMDFIFSPSALDGIPMMYFGPA
jgi:hypothetical protein